MDLPTQALALGYLSLSWGFGTILGECLPKMTVVACECGLPCNSSLCRSVFQLGSCRELSMLVQLLRQLVPFSM